MVPSPNYLQSISGLQAQGNALAKRGKEHYAAADTKLREALLTCENYVDPFVETAHKARLRRDIAVLGIRAALASAQELPKEVPRTGILSRFEALELELVASGESLLDLSEAATLNGNPSLYREHLIGEAGISGAWRMRLRTAWGLLETPENRAARHEEAFALGRAHEADILTGGNTYYGASYYGAMARLAVLRGQAPGHYIRRSLGMVTEAFDGDKPNFWPALRTFGRAVMDVFAGADVVEVSILDGHI